MKKLIGYIGVAALLATITLTALAQPYQNVVRKVDVPTVLYALNNTTVETNGGAAFDIPPDKPITFLPCYQSDALVGNSNVVYSFNGCAGTNWTTSYPISVTATVVKSNNYQCQSIILAATNFTGFDKLRLDKVASTSLTNVYTTNFFISFPR